MAKDLRLDVVTTSDGKGLVESAEEVEHLAKEIDKLGTQMRETAVDADGAGHEVDKMGDQMRQAARDSGMLALELEATKVKMKELGAEFDQSGDKTILKQISSTRRYSSSLQRLKQDMEGVGQAAVKEGEKVGADLGKAVETGMEDSVGDVPMMVPVLIGALTSPGTYGILATAGAMMGGAILTGIGLAGIGTGVALSINSPAVGSAIDRLKSDVSSGLNDAAESFVTPLATAVGVFDDEFRKLQPDIKATFAEIAPEVEALAQGAAGFIDQLVPAFDRAIVASKPLLDMLAADLPDIGHVVAGMFDAISANSGVAEQGLQDIVVALEKTITFFTGLIVIMSAFDRATNDIYYTAANVSSSFMGAWADMADAIHLPGNGLDNLRDKFQQTTDRMAENKEMAEGVTLISSDYATTLRITASNMDYLSTELLNFNTQLSAMNGLLNRTEALNNLTIGVAGFVKQLKDSKDAFDASSAAGAQNQNTYIGLVKNAEEYRQMLINTGVTQSAADKAFQDMIKTIDAAAIAAGLSKKQIEDLNKQLGITAAMKPIDVHINVKTNYSTTGQRPSLGNNIPIFGDGGHFDPGPILVGDKGPEILWPDSAGTIIPNIGSPGGGGHAPASVTSEPTVVRLEAVGPVAEVLLSLLRPTIAGSYGGDVVAALAGNRN